jgi:nitroreductase
VDATITLTHFDIAVPASGIGTCWAGFFPMATAVRYEPLPKVLTLPVGRRFAYSLRSDHPEYKLNGIPSRKPFEMTWQ